MIRLFCAALSTVLLLSSIGCGGNEPQPSDVPEGSDSASVETDAPDARVAPPAGGTSGNGSNPSMVGNDGPGSGSGFDIPPDLGKGSDAGGKSADGEQEVGSEFQLPPSVSN